jgi:hypothetical protein
MTSIAEAIEAQRPTADACARRTGVTADVALSRALECLEWMQLVEGAVLNAYTVALPESSSGAVGLGLNARGHVTAELRKRALDIDARWLEQFPKEAL